MVNYGNSTSKRVVNLFDFRQLLEKHGNLKRKFLNGLIRQENLAGLLLVLKMDFNY